MTKTKAYIAIDLKSFYASVECKERNRDPLTTNLVVADQSRTEKTICLAVSPSLKSYGIPGRPRLFEVVQKIKEVNNTRRWKALNRTFTGSSDDSTELNADPALKVDYIVAPPRMEYYLEYSSKIYNIYLAMDIVAKHTNRKLTVYASANATLIATLDRLFYSTQFDTTMKVGASVVCARRGGCSATFDELNKYFTISGMPVASSQYWNSIHGRIPGEAEQDGEGKQTMRVLARNMTFLMKSIALGKEQFGLPEKEERIATHFIR